MKVVLFHRVAAAHQRTSRTVRYASCASTIPLFNPSTTRDAPYKGSSIGSDPSMISANHRLTSQCNINHNHCSLSINTNMNNNMNTNNNIMKININNIKARAFSTAATATATVTATAIATDDSTNNNNNNNNTTSITAAAAAAAAMEDEYGEMTNDGHTFIEPNFVLENGTVMEKAQLRYQTYGKLNETTRDNVIVVCHALTGNASLHSWWGDLLGKGKAFDTSKYLIVCCNILGSCYGSTSPQSNNPAYEQTQQHQKTKIHQKTYSKDFPDVSVQDTVKLQLLLLQKELKLNSVKAVIGGSFGGMQAVEFAVQAGRTGGDFTEGGTGTGNSATNAPPFVKSVIPIACGAAHTAWQIAVSEVQRQAIMADPHWSSDEPEKATAGLAVARQMGMVSYRTPQGYHSKFGRKLQQKKGATEEEIANAPQYGSKVQYQAQSYLHYQGTKFLSRFDPVTYVKMTEQMDSHDISRGRGASLEEVLATVEIPALVMGIDSDVLYPLEEQEFLADALPNGTLKVIHSPDGHDGFLLEQEQVGNNIIEFLNQERK